MTEKSALPTSELSTEKSNQNGSLVLGAGLAVASMILALAIAMPHMEKEMVLVLHRQDLVAIRIEYPQLL